MKFGFPVPDPRTHPCYNKLKVVHYERIGRVTIARASFRIPNKVRKKDLLSFLDYETVGISVRDDGCKSCERRGDDDNPRVGRLFALTDALNRYEKKIS